MRLPAPLLDDMANNRTYIVYYLCTDCKDSSLLVHYSSHNRPTYDCAIKDSR